MPSMSRFAGESFSFANYVFCQRHLAIINIAADDLANDHHICLGNHWLQHEIDINNHAGYW